MFSMNLTANQLLQTLNVLCDEADLYSEPIPSRRRTHISLEITGEMDKMGLSILPWFFVMALSRNREESL